MSTILWQKHWAPEASQTAVDFHSESYQDTVTKTRALPVANDQMVIPDPRAYRSMSRASLILSSLAMQAKKVLTEILSPSPFAVGVYCAVENGPIDAATTVKILEQPETTFAESYRKIRNPKLYLKQLPNLVPAQMGISLGLLGRMNVYTHSTEGSVQALEQAEWDLKTKKIRYAVVCAASAFDDYLVVKRMRSQDMRTLAEGAAFLLLKGDGEFTDRTQTLISDSEAYFGIADPLINLVKGT